MTVYILGGGPTGLALAHGITEGADKRFVLIEKDESLGGLARTVTWDDHGQHDLGPHKIFTLDKDLLEKVEGLLSADEWLLRPKTSSIYMKGHFLPYPPSPFSLLGVYGPARFSMMVLNYGLARLSSMFGGKEAATFEEDLHGRLGRGIYEALFEPIALKLWGDPKHLDSKLSMGRVQTPSLVEIVGRILRLSSTSEFEALEFKYPKGGLQKIWDSIVDISRSRGEFLTSHEVTCINTTGKTVTGLCIKDLSSGEQKDIAVGSDDYVFSTLPMGILPGLMGSGITDETKGLIRNNIQLNDLILVMLKVDRQSLLDDCWVFVPDPDIVFHRLSEQESFDPDMAKDGSIVCCEIMSNDSRDMSGKADRELIDLARKGLQEMGYKGYTVTDERVIRLPSSYPVYRPGYLPALEKVINELDGFKNLRSIGRQGAFNYIGTLDAMDIGYGAARWFKGRQKGDADEYWKLERQRTSHYPVLD